MAPRKSILAADPITLPDGRRMALADFLTWWKSRSQPSIRGKGAGTSCTLADLLADCFASCMGGPISFGTPGPVCGWTFSIDLHGNKGGNVTFTPAMSLNASINNQRPAVKQSIILASALNLTMQLEFTEFSTVIGGGNSVYEFLITNAGKTEGFYLYLDDTGAVLTITGDFNTGDWYTGTWTPNNGTHTVHMTVTAGNVPALWIDGISIPLAFSGPFGNTGGGAQQVEINFGNGASSPVSAEVSKFFLASGVLPPSTVFCCP